MTRLFLFFTLLLLLPTTVFAAPQSGDVGLFFDEQGTLTWACSEVGVPFDVFVVTFAPPNSIRGVEVGVDLPPNLNLIDTFMLLDGTRVGSGTSFIMGFSSCLTPTWELAIVRLTVVRLAPTTDDVVCLTPSTPSSVNPPVPAYLDCAYQTRPFGAASAGLGTYPDGCAVVCPTSEPPVATERTGFGVFKARY